MKTNLPSEEIRFAKNATVIGQAINTCVNKLQQQGYKTVDPMILTIGLSIIESQGKNDPHAMIKLFIKNSHESCWDKIKERDEHYFVHNVSKIFSALPPDTVNIFKDLFLTVDNNGVSVISQKLKDEIWGLLDAMIKISIKYINKHRHNSNDYENVKLEHHAKVWTVVL
jgi:hypothetical protein